MKIKKGDKLDIELPTSEGRLFNLKETPSDDATDAIAIAVCHALSNSTDKLIEDRIIN